jgi:hypothetical protein
MYAINYAPYLVKDIAIVNKNTLLKSASVVPQEPISSNKITISKNASTAYPNPFETSVNFLIDFKDNTNNSIILTIISADGKMIYSKQYKNFDVENIITWNGRNNNGQDIKSGIYFYSIKSDKNEIKGILVKQ